MKNVFIFCLLICQGILTAQSTESYPLLAEKARIAYSKGEHRKALKTYTKAFQLDKGEYIDMLRAAISAHVLTKYEVSNRLFIHLFQIAPLETTVIFLDAPEFGEWHNEPLGVRIMGRAAYALGPSQNGNISGRKYLLDQMYVNKTDLYISLVEIARQSMLSKNYQRAFNYYKRVLAMGQYNNLSKLRAATCAFQLGNIPMTKEYLNEGFEKWPAEALAMIRFHPEFTHSLENDNFAGLIGEQISKHFPGFDPALAREIDQLWEQFLIDRQPVGPSVRPYAEDEYYLGFSDSTLIGYRDSLRYILSEKAEKILSRVGVPPRDLVADRQLMFLTVLNGVRPELLDQHWEELRSAFLTQEAFFYLPRIYDHCRYQTGKKQRFGTRITYPDVRKKYGINFWPVEDPEHIDERRSNLGLKPMAEAYLRHDLPFNLEAQKRVIDLPEIHRVKTGFHKFQRSLLIQYPGMRQ